MTAPFRKSVINIVPTHPRISIPFFVNARCIAVHTAHVSSHRMIMAMDLPFFSFIHNLPTGTFSAAVGAPVAILDHAESDSQTKSGVRVVGPCWRAWYSHGRGGGG